MINNHDAYNDSFVDYGPLENACRSLGTALRFSDIDLERERNSRWLRMEWKGPGVGTQLGQQINFSHLTALPFTTVIEVWGAKGYPESCRIVGQMVDPAPCTVNDLARMCVDWDAWARSQPRPDVQTDEWGTVTVRTGPAWRWQS